MDTASPVALALSLKSSPTKAVLRYFVWFPSKSVKNVNFQLQIPKLPPSLRPHTQVQFFIMSKHSSLKAKGSAAGKRSVMKRFERVKALQESGRWEEGKSPIGLPKTKVTS